MGVVPRVEMLEDRNELADAERGVPDLSLPFALVGMAAGWLCGRALGGPLAGGVSSGEVPGLAAAWCGLIAVVAGAYLTRCLRADLTPRIDRPPWPQPPLLLLVVLVGTAGGGAVGALVRYASVEEGLGLGALCALPFWPVCAFVVRYAKRAARGRMGSLVAASDRRAVWLALGASVMVATLVALPENQGLYPLVSGPPRAAVGIAALCAVVVMVVAVLDALAWRRLVRLADEVRTMEARSPGELAQCGESVGRTDLGLGVEVAATVEHGSAYRHRGRVTAFVIGSHAAAREALGWALRRGLAAVLVSWVVVALHAFAITAG